MLISEKLKGMNSDYNMGKAENDYIIIITTQVGKKSKLLHLNNVI